MLKQEQTAEETQVENQEAPEQEEQQPEAEPEQPEETEGEAQPEGEESEEAAPEPEADAAEAEKAAAAAAEEKRRRKGGWERRAERAERRAEQLERERALLMEEVAARRPATPAAPEKPKDAADQARELIRAEAMALLEERRQQEEQARHQEELHKRMEDARVRLPDFDDALEGVAHIPVPQHIQDAILTSPAAPDIMYLLAKTPAELARIARLPPIQAAREIGRLEAKASFTPTPKAQPKPAARPPAPPTNVRGKAASTGEPDERLSMSDYKRAFRSGKR